MIIFNTELINQYQLYINYKSIEFKSIYLFRYEYIMIDYKKSKNIHIFQVRSNILKLLVHRKTRKLTTKAQRVEYIDNRKCDVTIKINVQCILVIVNDSLQVGHK